MNPARPIVSRYGLAGLWLKDSQAFCSLIDASAGQADGSIAGQRTPTSAGRCCASLNLTSPATQSLQVGQPCDEASSLELVGVLAETAD